jgi:hypothetical protein
VIRDTCLLRLRALLARARGDDAAYADFRDRYRDMAKTLEFDGHIAWAEAMPMGGRLVPLPIVARRSVPRV